MDETNVKNQNPNIDEEDCPKPETAAAAACSSLPQDKRICLIGSVAEDDAVVRAAHTYGVPVLTSETGLEYVSDTSCVTVFVLDTFSGPVFESIHKTPHRILGPIALRQLADEKEPLPNNTRPLYNISMRGVILCFTGFKKKDDLIKLIPLIHHMGGSVRKDTSLNVTHLIANCCGGEKYQYACTFRLPIMSPKWVLDAWENRNDMTLRVTQDKFLADHKLPPLHGARVCFVGFSVEETEHMRDVLTENGGTPVQVDDPSCTHVVVDESAVAERPEITSRALLVKAEWFWASVQNAACIDEKDYMFDDYLESILSPTRRESRSLATPNGAPGGSASGRRKRKRLHNTLGSLVRGTSLSGPGGPESPGLHKRRSSISDAGLLSVSSSFLDCTASPDKSLLDEPECVSGDTTTARKTLSPRQQVFMELVQTESNYVNILNTIMTMFKNHLEKILLDNEEEALLNNTELKIIFGNLPPIYETHSKMLEELRWASAHWSEDTSIGNIFLKYSADLIKAYPPFVNFFETMKEALIQCDQSKPRFHAFLKVCQTRPECGRQSLQELLIRPVQRLPSISLLLSDIIKHTPKANPDHSALEKALTSIREVITIINEDKRKTEGMVVMFNIHDQIDKCPADLVSSHRNFVTRCEVQQLSDGLSGRGDTLMFFLFTDTLEVCKKPKPKKGSGNSLKSPVTVNGLPPIKSSSSTTNKLPYKHVRLIHLSTIRKVIDIRETEDFHNGFALVCRNNLELNKNNQELKEDLYYFTVLEDEINKTNFLRTLCRQMANTVCQADADSFLACLDAHQLNIKSMDGASGTLSKANLYKLAEKTRMKVGRAFSFNKTPLKRAVSTMMSPFGSNANLTPSSQLAQMRLASCNNINELGGGNAGSPSSADTLVAPLSVQPTRKAKYSSLNIAALRRL